MMLMTGIGVLAAAVPVPQARATPDRSAAAAAPSGQAGYIFQDEFDGPAGSAPDPSKWAVAKARETIKDPTYWELPEHIGQYRDDRRNVFVDGNSNLVLACRERRPHLLQRQGPKPLARRRRPHLGSPDQTQLPDRRRLARLLAGQRRSGRNRHHRVVRQRQLALGHHRPRQSERRRMEDPQHRGGQRLAHLAMPVGRRPASASGRTTSTARSRTSTFRRARYRIGRSTAPATPSIRCSISRSPVPVAVIPAPGSYPAEMLVDWIRVW